jgi:hypothetical protein
MDGKLNVIKNNTENLYICKTAQPTTFAEATGANCLGVKAAPSFTGPANGDTNGRKLTIDAITGGSASADGLAAFFALCDDSASKLLYANALNNTQQVTNGNSFSLTAMKIEDPDPAT